MTAPPASGKDAVNGRASYWRDVAWQLSGSSLAQLVGVAGIPVLTRLYSPEEFAVQSLFLQVVTYATALVTWRYEYFVQLPKSEEDVRALNRAVLVLGCCTVLVATPVFWLFRDLAAAQLGNSAVAPWLVMAPVTAVLFSWAVAIQNNAQRRGDFKTSGLSELFGKLAYVATGIAGAFVHPGAGGLVFTSAASAVGKAISGLTRSPAQWVWVPPVRAGAVSSVLGNYGKLASSTVFSHLLSTSAIALPQVAMARMYGADTLGQFSLVMATVFLPAGLLGVAIGQVYYQRAAAIWARGTSFFDLWRDMVKKLLIVGIPVYTAVVLLSGVAYPFVFGDEWQQAGEFARWMAVAAFASFVSSPMDRTCLIVGNASYAVLWSVFRLVTTLILVLAASTLDLAPAGFGMALAAQMCVVYCVDFWMNCRFSQGKVNLFPRPRGQ